jgi:hypothetical protein
MKRSVRGSFVVFALLLLASPAARADVSEAVQKKFKGQILVSAEPFPSSAADDAETIRQLKKAHTGLVARSKGESVPVWRFRFMAFMDRKPGATQVSLDFYTEDKKKAFVAQKRLAGIDPALTLLEAQVELSEDDGLAADRSYAVKLTCEVKGKEIVLATTKLRTK